ncbi:hypothetical protein QE152_g41332, partial [Popillia japonica]
MGPKNLANQTEIDIRFSLLGTELKPKKAIKYLGIVPDAKQTFGDHAKQVIRKAENSLFPLTAIRLNVGGPSGRKRRVLYGAVQSIVLYGGLVWASVVRVKKYSSALNSLQRGALVRVASACRTMTYEPLQVIAR